MNKLSDKAFFRIAVVVTIVVTVLVIVLNRRWLNPPEDFPGFIYHLPKLHALINGTTALLLLLSLRAIRARNVARHRAINFTAFALSALFLISYVVYHFFVPETTYGGEGALRTIYYVILISHIITAALVLPFILIAFWHGTRNNIEKHRKVVRYAYPLWLYVAVTGVLVYLLISPYYSFV